jgi:hypothetical protein
VKNGLKVQDFEPYQLYLDRVCLWSFPAKGLTMSDQDASIQPTQHISWWPGAVLRPIEKGISSYDARPPAPSYNPAW